MARRYRRRRRSPLDDLGYPLMIAIACLVGFASLWQLAAAHLVLSGLIGAAVIAAIAAAAAVAIVLRRRAQQAEIARTTEAHAFVDMSWDQFEHALANLCRRDGCRNVRVVGGSGDLGADVTAVGPNREVIVLQAKRYRYESYVGSPDLQKFGGTCFQYHHADVAAFVTTARAFSRAAKEYARKVGIVVMDMDALSAWASQTGPPPWDLHR